MSAVLTSCGCGWREVTTVILWDKRGEYYCPKHFTYELVESGKTEEEAETIAQDVLTIYEGDE